MQRVLAGQDTRGLENHSYFLVDCSSSLWQFHFCRSLIAIPLMYLMMKLTNQKFIINNLSAVIIRSALYTISMIIYFGCLSFLQIAIVGAGMFTSPIFVLIFSYFLFKQKIGTKRISAVVIGSIGVWLILSPSNESFSILNFLPILGGAFLAMGNMTTWRMCSEESPLMLNILFYLGIGIVGFIGTIVFSYLNLGIQVKYLAFPRAGLDSFSFSKIASAWCSEDPNAALTPVSYTHLTLPTKA